MKMKIMQNIGCGVVIVGMIIIVLNGFKNLDGPISTVLAILTLSTVAICFVLWIKDTLKRFRDHD